MALPSRLGARGSPRGRREDRRRGAGSDALRPCLGLYVLARTDLFECRNSTPPSAKGALSAWLSCFLIRVSSGAWVILAYRWNGTPHRSVWLTEIPCFPGS